MSLSARIFVGALSLPFLISSAAADGWSVARISGKGWLVSESVAATPAVVGNQVAPGFTVATGPNSRIMLVNGGDTMQLGPNSKVAIPYKADRGLKTTVFQQIGSLDLSIDKQATPHFSVQTPWLAAVVKGTEFNVTVADGIAKVSVTRGVVAVADLKTGERSEVAAGQAASTTSTAGLQVSGVKSAPSIHSGATQKSQVVPTASSASSASAASSEQTTAEAGPPAAALADNAPQASNTETGAANAESLGGAKGSTETSGKGKGSKNAGDSGSSSGDSDSEGSGKDKPDKDNSGKGKKDKSDKDNSGKGKSGKDDEDDDD